MVEPTGTEIGTMLVLEGTEEKSTTFGEVEYVASPDVLAAAVALGGGEWGTVIMEESWELGVGGVL